ncbi:recombinase family protein [Nocardia nova]|uniref:recombinase family protein n=1 Tax=Nocardia nova TaxID=37330 RepID=UPI001FE8CA6A|nr:recombinase family protein [Nocardia nova]
MRIGYGRVSTTDQNPDAQRDALAAAGSEQIFLDKASGKLATRPELDEALLVATRPGDRLVVTKLHSPRQLDLPRPQLRLLPTGAATRPCSGQPVAGGLGHQGVFEFGDGAEDLEEHAPDRGRGVDALIEHHQIHTPDLEVAG